MALTNRDLFSQFCRLDILNLSGPHTLRGNWGESILGLSSSVGTVFLGLPWLLAARHPSLGLHTAFCPSSISSLPLPVTRTYLTGFRAHPDDPGLRLHYKILNESQLQRPFYWRRLIITGSRDLFAYLFVGTFFIGPQIIMIFNDYYLIIKSS